MKIEELPLKSPYLRSEKLVQFQDRSNVYTICEKPSLEVVFEKEFEKKEYLVSKKLDSDFLFNLPKHNKGLIFNLESHVVSEFNSESSVYFQINESEFFGIDNSLFHYTLLDENFKKINSFNEEEGTNTIFSKFGLIVLTKNREENNYLQLINPYTKEVIYHFEMKGYYTTCECRGRHLILEEICETGRNIHCIDLELKKLNWTLPGDWNAWYLFDEKNESVVISYNRKFYEKKLNSDKVINQFTLNRDRDDFYPERIISLSESSVYFYNGLKENVLGKINRVTGEVIWEVKFLPEGCSSLNIWSWTKLSIDKHLIYVFDQKNPKLLLMTED